MTDLLQKSFRHLEVPVPRCSGSPMVPYNARRPDFGFGRIHGTTNHPSRVLVGFVCLLTYFSPALHLHRMHDTACCFFFSLGAACTAHQRKFLANSKRPRFCAPFPEVRQACPRVCVLNICALFTASTAPACLCMGASCECLSLSTTVETPLVGVFFPTRATGLHPY